MNTTITRSERVAPSHERDPRVVVGAEPRRFSERLGDLWIGGVLVVLVIGLSIAAPSLLSRDAWVAFALAATEVVLVAVGMTFVLIGRGIDLSIGANLGLSGMLSALTMSGLLNGGGLDPAMIIVVGAIVSIAVGLLVGIVNGLGVTLLDINPLIVTLGSSGVALGVTQLVSGGQQVSDVPDGIFQIGSATWFDGWLPVPAVVAAVVATILGLVLALTRFGQRTYAIGSNPDAAIRTGIAVKRHTVAVYAIAGGCAGVAGFLVMCQLGAAAVTAGQSDTLPAIAAAVIGGVSLFGGRGHILGAVIGAMIITVLQTGLVVAKVDASWQVITVGLVLVAAVFIDQQRQKIARNRR